MEISSAQAMPAGWDAPAKASAPFPAGAAPNASRVSTPQVKTPAPSPTPAQQQAHGVVVLAQVVAADQAPPPPPAKPVEQSLDFHPLASAAGRYPLIGKMLEDVFGLETALARRLPLSHGIDLAA